MKKYLLWLGFIFATIGIAAAGDRIIRNPNVDKDTAMCVNDGGVEKCLTIDGTTGNVTADGNIAADSATTANTAVNFSGSLSGDVTGTQGATSLGALTVDTGELVDGAVTYVKTSFANNIAASDIGPGAVGTSEISDGSIANVDINSSAGISFSKMQTLTGDRALVTSTPGVIGPSAITATELGYLDNVSSNIQTQLNAKQATITGGASTITSSNLTANRALISNGSGKAAVSAVTSTELGYVDGVTSAIQTQLNGKAPSSNIAWSAMSNLTTNRALYSNGSGDVTASAVTSTELGYLDGVTSAIQTQLNGKQPNIATGTDNRMVKYNGTSNVQQTGITVNDSNNVTGMGTLSSGAISSSGAVTGTVLGTGFETFEYDERSFNANWSCSTNCGSVSDNGNIQCVRIGKFVSCHGRVNVDPSGVGTTLVLFPASQLEWAYQTGLQGSAGREADVSKTGGVGTNAGTSVYVIVDGHPNTGSTTWVFNFQYFTSE